MGLGMLVHQEEPFLLGKSCLGGGQLPSCTSHRDSELGKIGFAEGKGYVPLWRCDRPWGKAETRMAAAGPGLETNGSMACYVSTNGFLQ